MEVDVAAGGGLTNLAPARGGLVEELHVMAPDCGATGWRIATRLRGSLGPPSPGRPPLYGPRPRELNHPIEFVVFTSQ